MCFLCKYKTFFINDILTALMAHKFWQIYVCKELNFAKKSRTHCNIFIDMDIQTLTLFKNFIVPVFFIRWLNYFRDFSEFWLVGLLSLQCFNLHFVDHYNGCTLIYQPLSYPFRSLDKE